MDFPKLTEQQKRDIEDSKKLTKLVEQDIQEALIKFAVRESITLPSRSLNDVRNTLPSKWAKKYQRAWLATDGNKLALRIQSQGNKTKTWKTKADYVTVARWVDSRFVVVVKNLPPGHITPNVSYYSGTRESPQAFVNRLTKALDAMGVSWMAVDTMGESEIEQVKFVASLKGM